MSAMRRIVLRGGVKDREEHRSEDHISSDSLLPFAFQERANSYRHSIPNICKRIKCFMPFVGTKKNLLADKHIPCARMRTRDMLIHVVESGGSVQSAGLLPDADERKAYLLGQNE